MGLVDPRKGINNWLRTKGVKNNERQQYLISRYNKEVESLDLTPSYSNRFNGSKRQERQHAQFMRFTQWFLKNRESLIAEYIEEQKIPIYTEEEFRIVKEYVEAAGLQGYTNAYKVREGIKYQVSLKKIRKILAKL